MIAFTPKGIKRVLCLGAHPDDIELGCGSTILSLIQTNPVVEFYWVVFSGDAVRREEARNAAKAFLKGGRVKRVRTERFRESYFPSQWPAIKSRFESVRKEFDPDIVFTHCRHDRHQDHRVLSDLAWNTFRNHLVLEYEILKYDGDLGTPNLYAPMSEEIARRKVELILKQFRSQSRKHWFTSDAFLSLMRIRGIECAAPGRYAEAYYGRKVAILT
jgi:LmbE family N-acetylglucosaminyl deacetylase